MIASLNHSSSPSSLGSALMSGATFTTRPSCEATKHEDGVLLLIDAQPDPAPFEDMPLAGHQVLDRLDALPRLGRSDLDLAEMKPELERTLLRQGHRDRHGIIAAGRLLDEADHLVIVDLREAQPAGLQQGGIVSPHAIETADVGVDVARLVPVPELQLVFFGVEIFLLARDRLVLEQLEPVEDAVIARQRGGERDAGFEDPRLAGLQMKRQNVRRVDEKVGPEIFALRIAGDLAQIGLQLLLARPPREIGVGLGEAELGERL